MHHRNLDRTGQRGQALTIFALAIVAIMLMSGLVVDGGDAFAQRRAEQNVADLSAMAGAYGYANATGDQSVRAAAAVTSGLAVAAANGYPNGVNGVSVTISVVSAMWGTTVTADVTGQHRNYFASIIGMSTWPVSTTATVQTGAPNAAVGAFPLIFNQEAFGPDGLPVNPPNQLYNEPGSGNEDVPQDATQFNWTVFCTANGNPCNANSNTVRDIINGNGVSTVVTLGDDIGPLNAGAHTTLFTALETHLGSEFPVAIVDDEGVMVGWAIFHLTETEGGSEKVLGGYFVSPVNSSDLSIVQGGCPDDGSSCGSSAFGAYVVRLID